MRNRFHTKSAAAIRSVAVLGLAAFASGAAPAAAPAGSVELVDADATAATRSLFSYLRDVRGEGILYGHQHDTSYGVTVSEADGKTSDINNGVGDFPAVFGWDTLIIEGRESPGRPENTPEENVAAFTDYLEKADRIGGISTISAHMKNFVTGGSFSETGERVVERLLPGGDKQGEFNAYLDNIALLANSVKRDDGEPVPLIFRPFHENAGSWFWWGASYATPDEYVELWRYTVEYLRDTKGVSNLLYAYSPGGGFGGDAERYLSTYPGDDYVDILGIDSYDDSDGSQEWLDSVTLDLAMIARLADEKEKVSALTEFGEHPNGLLPNGENGNLQWYTRLLEAVMSDPDARRTAYMQTWANFGPEQYYAPHAGTADLPEHELLADFRAFYADPRTVFADDLEGVFGRSVQAVAHDPFLHIVSPTNSERVTQPETTVRARVLGLEPEEVFFRAGDKARQPLKLDAEGYYSGPWQIGAEQLTNDVTTLEVVAVRDGEEVLLSSNRVVLGEKPPLGPGVVDGFEDYADDLLLRGDYATFGSNTISLSEQFRGAGDYGLKFDYDFSGQTYTGFGKAMTADWSSYDGLRLWLKPDGSNHKLVLQLDVGDILYEGYPSLAGTEAGYVTLPWGAFRPPPRDTENQERLLRPEDLANLAQFNIYLNQVPGEPTVSGSLYLDDIRAVALSDD